MTAEGEAFDLIVDGVRRGVAQLAERCGSSLVDASSEPRPDGAPPIVLRLVPSRSQAAPIEVMPDDAWSTYVSIGVRGWVEVLTSPKRPEAGVAAVLELVTCAAEGRVRERVWRRRGTGEIVNSLLYVQQPVGGRWRVCGEVSRPLPVLCRRFDEELVEYEAHGPPGASAPASP